MNLKRNPITSAVQKALLTGLVAATAFGPVAQAQDSDDESVEEQGKITVTGSRIKRSDVEGALPITVITREQIELSGESNAADFIRNLTFNSAGSFRPQSGSSAQGDSTVSLRALGSGRTLVLIDNRRLPVSPSTGSSQNLSTLPMGAIERIEVLTDGASAIYGSDAIGGVINVITRDDYQGAEIMLGGAEVSIPANGGEREEGSIVFGASSDRSSLLAGVSWNDREIIFARDLPWRNPGSSVFGNSFTTLTAGVDNNDWTSYITGCDFPGTGFFTTPNSNAVNPQQTRCAYDFTLVSADEASTENKSFYAKASHEINDSWELWANATFSQAESFGRYAPVPDSSFFSTPLTVNSPNNPTNPNSPLYDPSLGLDPQPVNWWHRFDALGNRDNTVTNQVLDFLVGTTGQIGNAEVEFGLRHTDNRTSDVGRNYLLRSAAANLIESGAYNLANPYANPATVLNTMRITIFRDSKYDQDELFGSVAFDMFDMDGGPASLYIGAEHRQEKYADIYDPQSSAGQVGGSSGNSAAGDRDVTAVFFEALFPFTDNLEVNVAGRYDDYSDFGDNFAPKVSLRYQPLDNLTLRASYGQGFRAPTLDILTQQTTFSATTVRDPQSCLAQGQASTCSLQINDFIQANAALQPEDSDQWSVGLAYEPVDWFNFTLDYYNIEITNRIRQFTAQAIINNELNGLPNPPGLSCLRAPSGSIISCRTGFGNDGEVETSGLDLNARFNYEVLGGNMTTQFQLSHILDLSVDGGPELIKTPGFPQQRAILSNQYAYGDWSLAYNINYISDQNASTANLSAPSWTTHDVQLNYHAPWDGRFTVGVRNAGEKFPPVNRGNVGDRDYDFNLYDGYGRVTYFRYTQTF
ncbi:TonB-dependent receptor plug domain-containing protein [Marinicella meishanensis]|uniref:TonB-dependent receptor plug domain-containing protein n=1 Tax=Marinicella meishanensis TaxID=2873263 RepID=UPI001CBBEE43|nr:TonB-dependent receptor [Marinicella sp. NBU2979]